MKSMKMLLLAGTILALAAGSAAAAMQKGSSVLGIQITDNVGDFAPAGGGTYVFPIRHAEMGVQAQYWHLMRDDYALALSGGLGFAKETDNPGPNAPVSTSYRDTYSSWKFRAGGDRVAKAADHFYLFAGPGIQVWGGKVKNEGPLFGTVEGPTVVRYGLDGRIGVMLNWSESFGMVGQFGHYWAYASAKEDGAEAKWTPSGPEAAMGFFFGF